MTPIGLIDANDQLVEASLDGWTGYIGLSWNEAGGFWTMSVRDLKGEYLASSIPLSPLWPLLGQVRRAEFPPGEIVVDTFLPALDRRCFADGLASLLYLAPDDIADLLEIDARNAAPVREGVSAAPPRSAGNAPLGYVGVPEPPAGAPAAITDDALVPLTDDAGRILEI